MDNRGQEKISMVEASLPEGKPLQMDRMTQYRYRALDPSEVQVSAQMHSHRPNLS